MRLNRRGFVAGLAGAALAGAAQSVVVERRLYGAGSLLPPREILNRSGIRVTSVRQTRRGTEYRMLFDSLESRCQAWDRFNSDPAWCILREQSEVRLREIVIGA